MKWQEVCKLKTQGVMRFNDLSMFNDECSMMRSWPNRHGAYSMTQHRFFIGFLKKNIFPIVLFWKQAVQFLHHTHGVKLNLFNYVLALFRAKFVCNSVFRNPVFRWE